MLAILASNVVALEGWRFARSFLEALDVANAGAVAVARMSLGRRVCGVLGPVARD